VTRWGRMTIGRADRQRERDTSHLVARARRSLLRHVLLPLEGRAVLTSLPRCADPEASERRTCARRGSTIPNATIVRASVGRRLRAGVSVNPLAGNEYVHGVKPTRSKHDSSSSLPRRPISSL